MSMNEYERKFPYHKRISQLTGETDHALLNDIVDLMQAWDAIDRLDDDAFKQLALDARQVALKDASSNGWHG